MSVSPVFSIVEADYSDVKSLEGDIVILVNEPSSKEQTLRRIDRYTRGALARAVGSETFHGLEIGGAQSVDWPSGLAAQAVHLVYVPFRTNENTMMKAGVTVASSVQGRAATVFIGSRAHAGAFASGMQLGGYRYEEGKSERKDAPGAVTIMCTKPEQQGSGLADARAVADGVVLTRNLVNAPANFLTTSAFAAEAEALRDDGVEVSILDEEALEKLGMRLLLSVGQGSESPSYVAVMKWNGGASDAKPLALVGKGVVFDTGGISLKPAAGMEEMTMDMGGAGVVTGVMKTLARRQAKANVVGLIGLVENMPSGRATRPGDIVTSMQGDTVEIINTDAEGRLVLADVLRYAQNEFDPAAIIDLATLTGAMIIALGHEKAGIFSNDKEFASALLKACDATEEGAWELPLGDAYDAQLKSDLADMKNVGGRPAGSITAAQFLARFVDQGRPWIHIDIAGVARRSKPHAYGPKGASGWGVRALDRLVRERFEER